MSTSQYITVRETAQMLGISEKKVMDLVDQKKLEAYRIADQFLRLKRAEVLGLRKTGTVKVETIQFDYTPAEKARDFFYYNDFYLVTSGIILALLYIIFYF